MSRLKIALTKGRLQDKTLELLKKLNMDTSEIEGKSRKLIFSIPNSNLDIVLAKAADVITYVEHGACDIGVVGKDTIMESTADINELLELGFGKCKFALATLNGTDLYNTHKSITIATKYPKVARDYFLKKGIDIDVVKIEGSVELAPILNIADGIVDIVETGTTLKENGLSVIEEIADISARLIGNIASMKLKKKEINEFVERIEGVMK